MYVLKSVRSLLLMLPIKCILYCRQLYPKRRHRYDPDEDDYDEDEDEDMYSDEDEEDDSSS